MVEDIDAVRISHSGETVGYDDGGSVSGQVVQGGLYHFFSLGIQSGGSFVEDDYRRILEEHPGNGDALFLTA